MSTAQLESQVPGTDPATVTEKSESDETESIRSDDARSQGDRLGDDDWKDGEAGSDETVSDLGKRSARRWFVRSVAALIIVIAIVSSVFAGIFGWRLRQRDEVDTAAQQALSTAQTYAVALTSIDSQHIDDDYTHVLDGATGDFKNMYAQSSGQLKKMLIDNKARSVGKVVDASVQSASGDQVVVMLFVDQEITNAVSPDPRMDRSRIIMTMRSVGGRWLAAKVEMA